MHTINAGGEFCAFWVNCAKLESTVLETLRPNSVSHVQAAGRCRLQIFSVALRAGTYVPAGPITFS